MENKKSGFVSIIGRPNVGKSTLMNHLIGQKIAITSNKPQTTRTRIRTVYTDSRGQIVFLDTPGIHKAKNKLGEYMVETAEKAVYEADVILWIVEPTTYIGQGEMIISESLKKAKQPVILVINKIDTVTKEQAAEAEEAYRKVMDYTAVMRVCALRGTGAKDVLDRIFEYLPEGPFYYDEDTVTDQPMRQIAAEIIREKALRLLSDEIPHGVAVTIDKMKQRKDLIWDIDASVICERESHKGIIIGKGGQMLKKIGIQARQDIEKMLEDQVNLKLWVKVRENWRDSDLYMKNFGYHENNEL
ncbi:MAG: GTPase Era [Lachnospiraceae bacterium]|nr:GTPase Era [Lachnospiraceae bacterium]